MSKDLTQKLNDEKLDRVVAAVERIEARLDSLETKVDQRLKDTRPMWEAVQTQLGELRSEFKSDFESLRSEFKSELGGLRSEFKSELTGLRSEFKSELAGLRSEMEKGFQRFGRKHELHADSLADLRADWRNHEERLNKLEKVES